MIYTYVIFFTGLFSVITERQRFYAHENRPTERQIYFRPVQSTLQEHPGDDSPLREKQITDQGSHAYVSVTPGQRRIAVTAIESEFHINYLINFTTIFILTSYSIDIRV